MPAPVASGWSGCRVGLAPTGKAPPFHGARQLLSFDVGGRVPGTDWLLPFKFGGSMTAAADTGH
jgi:hypothetical protein